MKIKQEVGHGWLVSTDVEASPLEVHVIPVSDAIGHEETDECVCIPKVEVLENDHGGIGWLYTHHSLDGREQNE